jgi:hypothetical protein
MLTQHTTTSPRSALGAAGGSMLPPAPHSAHKQAGHNSSSPGAPTPGSARKLTKMSSKFRRDSASAASLTGRTPVVVLSGNGGLTPSLSSLEGQRSNPATPLFSPDTDAAFAALASTAAPGSAAPGSAAAAPHSVSKPARSSIASVGGSGSGGVSPRAIALAKAARLAQQQAAQGSPSADEARDLNAQLEAARSRHSVGAAPSSSSEGLGETSPRAQPSPGVAAQTAGGAPAAAAPTRPASAESMPSPPAANSAAAGLAAVADLLSPAASSSGSRRRKPQSAERWHAGVPSAQKARPAAPKPVEIVESIAVNSEDEPSFTSPRPLAAAGRPPQTPAQQDGGLSVGGSPSPSGKYWKEMRVEEHEAAALMGWTEQTWDAGDRAPFKAVWSEMDVLKQRAAMLFKFGPDHFAKPAKLQDWAGHEGWSWKRGTGLVTFLYISPDGSVYTSEQDAQRAYDAAAATNQQFSPRDRVTSEPSSQPQQHNKPSPQRRSPARSPILSPKSSKIAVVSAASSSSSSPVAEDTDSQDAGAYWTDMNKLQQTAAEMLGWNSRRWDDGDDTPFKKIWVDMTDDEHSAAFALNFEQSHFAKPKKPHNKKGKGWPGHDGWWIRRGTGLINWIYTAPDGVEYTDEQTALAAAASPSEDSPEAEDEADSYGESNAGFENEDDISSPVELLGEDTEEASRNGQRVKRKREQAQAQVDSHTSPLPSTGAAGADDAAPAQPSPKAVGDFIEANYMELGRYHPGVIKVQHPDGTFAVAYHDGDYEANVDRSNIRALRKRRRVPRSDLDQGEKDAPAAGGDKAKPGSGYKTKPAAGGAKTKPSAAKNKKSARKPPAEPQGPTAAQRKRVAQALRKAAEGVAECTDRSIDDKLGWLWKALVAYKPKATTGEAEREAEDGMDLLKHISTSGSGHLAPDSSVRRHSALFSPSANRRGAQRGAAVAATPAGTPHGTPNEKAFMWERLDGKKWRQLPDGNTWQRDGLVVLWTPCSGARKTLPELDQLAFELKCGGKTCRMFRGGSGEVRQGRQGKEECFIVITEAQLRECGAIGGDAGAGEIVVWNNDGTPDPNNESGIKMEDTFTGLPLECGGDTAAAAAMDDSEDSSFPPTCGLQVDMLCDAQDTAGGWNAVKIKETREGTDGGQEVKVHFMGWNDRHDKWMSVNAGQIAPEGTMSNDEDSAARHRWNGRRDSSSGSPEAVGSDGNHTPPEFAGDEEAEEEEETAEVAQVVQARQRSAGNGGGTEYKVRFKGCDTSQDTWVDESEIDELGAQEKLNRFHDREQKKAERKALAVSSTCLPSLSPHTPVGAPKPTPSSGRRSTHKHLHRPVRLTPPVAFVLYLACVVACVCVAVLPQEKKKRADEQKKLNQERKKEQQRLKAELREVSKQASAPSPPRPLLSWLPHRHGSYPAQEHQAAQPSAAVSLCGAPVRRAYV